jgi:hypothetical protein
VNTRLLLGVSLALSTLAVSPALGWEPIAPIASHVVTTELRTLRGCPRKHVVSAAEDWDRMVEGLLGAPPTPDFASQEVLLLITDELGGADSRVTALEAGADGELRLILTRRQPELHERGDPTLTCHFFIVPRGVSGLRLEIRTSLGESGFVQRPVKPAAGDRDPAQLPQLGPDIRLRWSPPAGTGAPAQVQVRMESTFPERPDLPPGASTHPFAGPELGLRFPRIRDGVRHVLGAYAPGLRSENPLVLEELPALDGSGSPAPVTHTFQLEPVPGRDR